MERRKSPRDAVVFRDKQLVVTRTFRPDGLRLVGAVDASNVEGVIGVLDSSFDGDASGRELHLDLTRLEFSDVSGIRALVVDPTVYEQLVQVLGGVGRSRVLRALVRYAISRDDEKGAARVIDEKNVPWPGTVADACTASSSARAAPLRQIDPRRGALLVDFISHSFQQNS